MLEFRLSYIQYGSIDRYVTFERFAFRNGVKMRCAALYGAA